MLFRSFVAFSLITPFTRFRSRTHWPQLNFPLNGGNSGDIKTSFFRMRAYVEAKHVITGACECVSAGCWTFRYFAGSPPGRFANKNHLRRFAMPRRFVDDWPPGRFAPLDVSTP